MSYGVGRRCGSDPALLQLWHRPAATAPIRPLAWESPCAVGAALENAGSLTFAMCLKQPPPNLGATTKKCLQTIAGIEGKTDPG